MALPPSAVDQPIVSPPKSTPNNTAMSGVTSGIIKTPLTGV